MAKMEKVFLEEKEVVELKRELQRMMQEIVEEDDYTVEGINHAMHAFCLLKEFKLNHHKSLPVDLPREFLCPISGELMKDPVVISSGQTFDRPSIENWLKDGHRTCPLSKCVLHHMILTPNHLLREIVSRWCNEHGIEITSPVEEIITNVDQGYLNSLLNKLSSSSFVEQKTAAKEIRQLTKQSPTSRAHFGEITNGIQYLLKPLSPSLESDDTHPPDLQEDLITTISNLLVHDSNKKLIAESSLVIPLLIESLSLKDIETKRNAVAAIVSLVALDSYNSIIGELGALKPLIDILEDGDPLAMKDASLAIFKLCTIDENRSRALSAGAIKVIMQKLSNPIVIEELLALLVLLCRHQNATEEMGYHGAVSCLLGILREGTNEINKENCIAILYTICYTDRPKLREIRIEEDFNGTITQLVQSGTSRAKRKAAALLELVNKSSINPYTT